MFTQAEVERLLRDKSVRRFMCFNTQITKGGAGTEVDQGKEYIG